MCKGHNGCTDRRKAASALIPALALLLPISAGYGPTSSELPGHGASSALAVLDAIVPPAQAASDTSDDTSSKWTCPMHPHYIADDAGTCPICGMDLVKVATDGAEPGAPADEMTADKRTAVTIAPEIIQNMGVRLAPAETSSFGRVIRSFGIVEENERLQTDITARVEGWIETLKVTAVGDEVEDGELLFELYSPQLIVSQNDYLSSRRSRDIATRAFTQLKALGVQPKALKQIEGRKRPMQRVPFYADRKGTIAELNLRQGTYVKRGMMLAKIQDYSKVWLMVSVAEKDLGFITMTTPATVTFPNLPGRQVKAMVDYVYPTIDAKTRTGQVRLVLDNPDGLLRPGSYADVSLEVGSERRVAVPSEAILKNGEGRFVVVSLGEGRFEPRRVQTGLTSGRWTEVTDGIEAGESVVVSGQFLLDSESALRESFRKLQKLQMPLSQLKLDKKQFAKIDHLIDAAIYLHEALVNGDDVEPKFLDPAISVRDMMWAGFKDTQLAFVLNDTVDVLRAAQKATSQSEVRSALAKLVSALRPWVLTGAPDHYRARKVMLFEETDGSRAWLQLKGPAKNPYGDGDGIQVPWPEVSATPVAAANGDGPDPNPTAEPSGEAKGMSGAKHVH